MRTTAKLWIGVGALAVLSPLGIFLPAKFKAGAAWGEWGPDEMHGLVGYLPEGLEKLASVWKAVIPDYAFKGWEEKGLGHVSLAYVVSVVIGIALCVGGAYLLGRILTAKAPKNDKPAS